MIWSVVSKSEMEDYKIPPVFHHYQEALGKENIMLAVVEEEDPLDFVNPETDVVLLRTASKFLVETILRKGVRSTAESFDKYIYTSDKAFLSSFLKHKQILVPNQYYVDEIVGGRTFFVKPRYGSESFGISEKSICYSKQEVYAQIKYLRNTLHSDAIIEEYIEGIDCTVACYCDPNSGQIQTHGIKVKCLSELNIQTHKGKFDYNEICSPLSGEEKYKVNEIAAKVFLLLELKHHARIDFRLSEDGRVFLIDVNLIPGLGPLAHFSKCLLLSSNMSYIDSLHAIIYSAS